MCILRDTGIYAVDRAIETHGIFTCLLCMFIPVNELLIITSIKIHRFHVKQKRAQKNSKYIFGSKSIYRLGKTFSFYFSLLHNTPADYRKKIDHDLVDIYTMCSDCV